MKLHGELLIPPFGDYVVELAACWALVLLVSGLYLWFPRTGSRIWGVLLPRLRGNGGRPFWRDLHAVSGFYGALLIGFMILTGLPWAVFWGTNFASVWTKYPDQRWGNYPKSSTPTGTLNTGAEKTVPWSVEQVPMPQSAHVHDSSHSSHGPIHSLHAGVGIDAVVRTAREKNVKEGFVVSLPQDPQGVFTISAPTDDPKRQATLHVDQYSGKIITDIRWQDYGVVPKAVEMGVAIHSGVYFGILNQLLMLFAALLVLVLAVSGTIMWWRRRPTKVLGAPPMPANFPLWKTAVAIIIVMGALFPLVGISLVVVLLLDYIVLSRIPRLKQVLG
jgi:uncharacterized iron-regulated membrane protein